jgi:GT2 family glycosyltransferase/glycosyltransferase involved in cell wall biosynthesis
MRPAVLVVGVYIANRPNYIRSLVVNLSATSCYRVTQRWVALGGAAHAPEVVRVTHFYRPALVPKFLLINELIAQVEVRSFEYIVIIDDDVLLPDQFLDRFLAAQAALGFSMAQPARTNGSYIDHPIVAQEPGTFARETRWVEVGPIVSIDRSIYSLVFPFDLRSPMGWGYENVWAYELSRHGHRMGIIDAFPVDHSLRPPHSQYNFSDAEAACRRLLAARAHLPLNECQQVLARLPARFPKTPGPEASLTELKRVGSAQLLAILDNYSVAIGRPCWVLDWHCGASLTETMGDHIVFSPTDGPPARLPYFGKSVDVVAVARHEPAVLREARRVARLAVAAFDSCDGFILHWQSPLARARQPSVSIIIPTYNGAPLVDDCVAALLPTLSAVTDVEVLIVDDASGDDTCARAVAWSAHDPRVRLLSSTSHNEGFIRSCNRGAIAARGDILILLNNDTKPQPGWLEALLRTFAAHPDAGAVGGKLVYPDGRLQEAGSMVFRDGSAANFGKGDPRVDDPLYNFVREVDYCSGALLATRRSVFFQLGMLDIKYLPAYYEDVDYCFKVRAAGQRVYYQPEALVMHIEGATGGTDVSRGVKHYQLINQVKFRETWGHVLLNYRERPLEFDRASLRSLATSSRGPVESNGAKRALVCSPVLPEFDRESGSQRLLDHIEGLQAAGWTVTFAAQHGQRISRYARMLERSGVETHCNFDETEELLSAGRFDLALLAFWQVAEVLLPAVRRLSPHTRVLVDSIDLHFLRKARRVCPNWNPRVSAPLDGDLGYEMRRELAVYGAADAVLTVSVDEADILRGLVGDALPLVAPDGEGQHPSTVPWSQRRGLIFIGNFRHPPNVEAVAYLCREIVPRIDPSVRARHPVYIVGNGLSDDIRALAAGLPGVVMVGWVASIRPYLTYGRVFMAPLLHGAGTKRKVIQALMVGTPTVATSIGIEGLPVTAGEHLLVANNARAFAACVARLAIDDALCQSLTARGRAAVAPHHSLSAARAGLWAALDAALARPTK